MRKKLIVWGGLTLIVLVYVFFAAPNLNPIYGDGALFWAMLLTIYLLVGQLLSASGIGIQTKDADGNPSFQIYHKKGKFQKWPLILLGTIWGIYLIAAIGSTVLFGSHAYRDQMSVPVEKEFTDDIQPLDLNQIPIVDRDLAYKLAGKQLGTDSALGSQVALGEPTIQQVNGDLVWVVPLQHSGFFKWLSNNEGAQGYIIVSATNMNDVRYIKDYKIKIQPDSYFMDDLTRHVRFGAGLFTGITDYSFELDESGKPYWVVTTYHNEWGFNLPEADGVILVDASTGRMTRYTLDNVPAWVDRVQPEEFILDQINNHGQYIHGLLNFSNYEKQKASPGHIIVYNNNRCYLFTGITSVGSDESAIKFMMVDMITKESVEYKITGATESAAQSSAEGKVQDLGYKATFPLILNIDSQPTYFMSLKDSEGLIKKYAFVSVKNYGIVGVGDTTEEALDGYRRATRQSNAQTVLEDNGEEEEEKRLLTLQGTVLRIAAEAPGDGDEAIYSLILSEYPDIIFNATSALSPELVLTQPGDRVAVEYAESPDGVIALTGFDNLEFSQRNSSSATYDFSSQPQQTDPQTTSSEPPTSSVFQETTSGN